MRRSILMWATLCAVAIVAVMVLGLVPTHAAAVASLAVHPLALGATLLGPAMVALVGRTEEVALPPAAGVTLASKSRAANELRAQAAALQAEILDVSKPLTTDELQKKVQGVKDLNARAAAIAEFTADDELVRRGADPRDFTRVDPREIASGAARAQEPMTVQKRIAQYAQDTVRDFGSVRGFLKIAVSGQNVPVSDRQKAAIQEARTLTRAIIGDTGDPSGGEFLLPLTQVQTIFSLANVQQGLLQRARAYNVPGRTLRIPYLAQTDDLGISGVDRPMAGNIANVSIIGEASTKAVRTPVFRQRQLTVFKYAAYTQVGDEMLADDFTGELPQEFINAVGQQALNKVNEDITIDGAGTSEPDGALKAGAAWTIAVTRNTGSTILPVDVFAMYARHTHGPNSVWLASRRTVQSLYNMSLTSASLVTFLRDLNGLPTMMLLGYPVVLTDLLPTLGSAGDLALVNPDFYAFALRQALTVELSREYAFVQDLTTYRFVVRAGGVPINTGKYAYKYTGTQGVDEHSPFVYLN